MLVWRKSGCNLLQAAPVKVKTSSDNLYSALVQNIRSVQATEPQQRMLPKKKRFSPETRKLTQVCAKLSLNLRQNNTLPDWNAKYYDGGIVKSVL